LLVIRLPPWIVVWVPVIAVIWVHPGHITIVLIVVWVPVIAVIWVHPGHITIVLIVKPWHYVWHHQPSIWSHAKRHLLPPPWHVIWIAIHWPIWHAPPSSW